MIKALLNKFLYSLLVLWGVASLVFVLLSILPGDPARMMLGQRDNEFLHDAIQDKYGFNLPIHEQYTYYLNDISPISIHAIDKKHFTCIKNQNYHIFAQKDFSKVKLVIKAPYLRMSFVRTGTSVSSIILDTLPNTILLAFSSMFIALFLGISLGLYSAVNYNKIIDQLLSSISVFGMALPSFFSAILIAWFFGYVLAEFTSLNMTGSLYEVDDYGNGEYIELKNLILPALTLGIRPLAVLMQLSRNSVLDELSKDYIRTARAKGLSKHRILWRHALPNALNPVITAASGWMASMLAGAVFVEYIFGWNGLGKEIVNALNYMDLPVVTGAVLTLSFCFIIITVLTDIIYYMLDPRIRI